MNNALQTVNKLITELNYGELEVLFSVICRRQRVMKEELEASLKNEVK